jgi:DNA mismatch repair protein MutS2
VDPKSLTTLELPKILDRLAGYCSFSGGAELARALEPTSALDTARRWQQETAEARKLLAVKTDITIGGARDVRPYVANAAIGGVLMPIEILDIKNTLIAARTLLRILSKLGDQFPRLAVFWTNAAKCSVQPPINWLASDNNSKSPMIAYCKNCKACSPVRAMRLIFKTT